jgi:hypothetical protein
MNECANVTVQADLPSAVSFRSASTLRLIQRTVVSAGTGASVSESVRMELASAPHRLRNAAIHCVAICMLTTRIAALVATSAHRGTLAAGVVALL